MKTPLNIAIVDDEPDALNLFKITLGSYERSGTVKLFLFGGGEDFLQFLKLHYQEIKIIILLSDINMPGMDGFQLLEHVRNEYPDIIVFVESAYNVPDYISKAKSLGAKEYFPKPVNFELLKSKINELL